MNALSGSLGARAVARRALSSYFKGAASIGDLKKMYIELAKKSHPDSLGPMASPAELTASKGEFIKVTALFEKQVKKFEGVSHEGSFGIASSEPQASTFDEALRTFFGVFDREQGDSIRRGMHEALSASGNVPAGLDKGGYWAAATTLGAVPDPNEPLSSTAADALGAGRKPRRKRT